MSSTTRSAGPIESARRAACAVPFEPLCQGLAVVHLSQPSVAVCHSTDGAGPTDVTAAAVSERAYVQIMAFDDGDL